MLMIRVSATTLFHVAAEQLGDATQWNRLAAINGLADPIINGVAELLVPPFDTTATGGLPPQ